MANELALASVTPQTWTMMRDQANVLVKTNFLPAAVKTPEQALAIMLKGRELGIPPMQALSSIAVIQGKPTAGAELMLALIYRDHGDDAIKFAETDATHCTIAYKRRSWKKAEEYSFTLEDAKRAGLSGQNWSKYPAAMLRARCISAVARMAFPDSIGGMYTPEELGANVHVDDTGEVLRIEEAKAPVVEEAEIVAHNRVLEAAAPTTNLFGEEQDLPAEPEQDADWLENLIGNELYAQLRTSCEHYGKRHGGTTNTAINAVKGQFGLSREDELGKQSEQRQRQMIAWLEEH